MLVDMVFSLDSVITAVGMTPHIPVMVAAVLVSAGVMLAFSGPVSDFVHRHPTMKMLALAFLILIGVMLMAEGFGQHIDRGIIYFAMAFSLGVELLNMRLRKPESADRPARLGHALGARGHIFHCSISQDLPQGSGLAFCCNERCDPA